MRFSGSFHLQQSSFKQTVNPQSQLLAHINDRLLAHITTIELPYRLRTLKKTPQIDFNHKSQIPFEHSEKRTLHETTMTIYSYYSKQRLRFTSLTRKPQFLIEIRENGFEFPPQNRTNSTLNRTTISIKNPKKKNPKSILNHTNRKSLSNIQSTLTHCESK